MAAKMVTVRRENGGNVLSLDPVEVEDSDYVVWDFPDLLNDQFGFVFFDTRFGPFHSVRSFSNRQILGKGNVGQKADNRYDYTAMIVKVGTIDPVATGRGELTNRAIAANTTPEVFVTYHPPSPGVAARITVEPLRLALNLGDTATWHVLGLPEDAFADFYFDPASPAMREATGPFAAFYAVNGREAGAVLASGMSFVTTVSDEDWKDSYRYHVEVRGADGKRLAAHDPIIDNLGPPPTPLGAPFIDWPHPAEPGAPDRRARRRKQEGRTSAAAPLSRGLSRR